MFNAKMLFDFIIHFDLARTDVSIGSDGHHIWFEKPSGEQWPLEFNLFEDGSYDVTIFNDNIYKNGDGEHITLEKGYMMELITLKEGYMMEVKNETNVQSNIENA